MQFHATRNKSAIRKLMIDNKNKKKFVSTRETKSGLPEINKCIRMPSHWI